MNKLKSILFASLLLLSVGLFADPTTFKSVSDSTAVNRYVYCELVGAQKFLSTKVTVAIDYGEETSFFKDTRLRDEETGKVHAFNSMVDALNYMGNNGWEFVQAYTVTMGQSNTYHWLLKMKKDDKQQTLKAN